MTTRLTRAVFLTGLAGYGLAITGLAKAVRFFKHRRGITVSVPPAKAVASMGRVSVSVKGAGQWKPDPPASYASTSGTVSSFVLESAPTVSGFGSEAQQTFHPNFNHLVQTPDGTIIVAYDYYDQNLVIYNRIKKIVPPYTSSDVTLLYDSQTQGDPTYCIPPAVEMDYDGNVYVVTNHFSRDGSQTNQTRIRKWTVGNYTGTGTLIATHLHAAGKWSVFLDQFRNWIWIIYLEESPNNLVAFDLSGNLVKQISLMPTVAAGDPHGDFTGPGQYGYASYPCLYVFEDGKLFVGFTAESTGKINNPSLFQSYYTCGFVYSLDGGDTFYGPNGQLSLPIIADGSGAANKTPFFFVHPGVDFKPGTDADYGIANGKFNWNHLNSMLFNNDCLHANYQSGNNNCFGGEHHVDVQFSMGAKAVTYRREPAFNSDPGDYAANGYHTQPDNTGSFCQGTDMNRRIHYVSQGRADQGNLGKISVFYCDNPSGESPSWKFYGQDSVSRGVLVNICASRFVNTDGSINVLAQNGLSPYEILFGRVTPA